MKLQSLYMKQYRASHPDYMKRHNDQRKAKRLENKILVMTYYSYNDVKCDCCGERIFEFLTIEHINNDGAEHRRKLKVRMGVDFYAKIIEIGFPEGLRVLCYNCNCAIRYTKICPHQK